MDLFSNTMAAAKLNELFPGKSHEHWMNWLQNNRNQSRRVAYRIPFERMSGGVFYRPEDLEAYAEWEKSRQLGTIKLSGRAAEVLRAYGIGERGGSTSGRKLNVTGINPQIDEASGSPYVQLITDDPLMVYRIELDEAKAIARELIEVIGVCERAAS